MPTGQALHRQNVRADGLALLPRQGLKPVANRLVADFSLEKTLGAGIQLSSVFNVSKMIHKSNQGATGSWSILKMSREARDDGDGNWGKAGGSRNFKNNYPHSAEKLLVAVLVGLCELPVAVAVSGLVWMGCQLIDGVRWVACRGNSRAGELQSKLQGAFSLIGVGKLLAA